MIFINAKTAETSPNFPFSHTANSSVFTYNKNLALVNIMIIF